MPTNTIEARDDHESDRDDREAARVLDRLPRGASRRVGCPRRRIVGSRGDATADGRIAGRDRHRRSRRSTTPDSPRDATIRGGRPATVARMALSGVADLVGRVLAGRYRLLAPIGTGASGRVYVADDVRLRRKVAVKVLHSALADDAGFLRRFRTEAQLAASLHHPNIMAVYDWGDDGVPFMVLELLEGGSLRGMLDHERRLSPAQAAHVGRQVAAALEYAHSRGLVHRDVKPANLLFDEHGIVRVADFGLARALAEASWTEPAGAVLGTARYAAPEQGGAFPLDGRADLYALALVIIESVTGRVPLVADTPLGTLAAAVTRRGGRARPRSGRSARSSSGPAAAIPPTATRTRRRWKPRSSTPRTRSRPRRRSTSPGSAPSSRTCTRPRSRSPRRQRLRPGCRRRRADDDEIAGPRRARARRRSLASGARSRGRGSSSRWSPPSHSSPPRSRWPGRRAGRPPSRTSWASRRADAEAGDAARRARRRDAGSGATARPKGTVIEQLTRPGVWQPDGKPVVVVVSRGPKAGAVRRRRRPTRRRRRPPRSRASASSSTRRPTSTTSRPRPARCSRATRSARRHPTR